MKRLIDKMTGPHGVQVVVHYDNELEEFRVRIMGKPEADYFTDDEADAKATMEVMAGWPKR